MSYFIFIRISLPFSFLKYWSPNECKSQNLAELFLTVCIPMSFSHDTGCGSIHDKALSVVSGLVRGGQLWPLMISAHIRQPVSKWSPMDTSNSTDYVGISSSKTKNTLFPFRNDFYRVVGYIKNDTQDRAPWSFMCVSENLNSRFPTVLERLFLCPIEYRFWYSIPLPLDSVIFLVTKQIHSCCVRLKWDLWQGMRKIHHFLLSRHYCQNL